jgi:hypothetical protein
VSLAVCAPRLPRSRPVRALLSAVLATGLLVGVVPSGPLPQSTLAATTPAPQAYALVIVGPTEGATASYIRYAKTIASQLRSLGARVTTLYSPHATWAAVKRAATGANLLIYLGHGNGWPNPHRSVSDPRKDNGFGLNIADGTSAKRYYGEYYMHQLKLAKGAVVIFNHACYTAGSAETGYDKTPTKPFVRADGYSSAFVSIGARATLATAGTPGPFIAALFTSRQTVEEAFWAMPTTFLTSATQRHPSKLVAGSVILQAPKPATRYYDAVSGDLSYTAAQWRATWK